jgi:protein-disulfide isomerase
MSNELKGLIGLIVITLAIIIGAAFFLGGTPQQPQEKPVADQALLLKADSHKTGANGGKVTIVEFGDYQCPACGSAHPNVKEVLDEYKDRVTFVYRHFPLPMHQHARLAAQAAEAAAAQGKFWEMHDQLFTAQNEWSESKEPLELFKGYAQKLGLDVAKFEEEIKSKKYEEKIQNDVNDGNQAGVNSTPTFFINGEMHPQVLSVQEFKTEINKRLNK